MSSCFFLLFAAYLALLLGVGLAFTRRMKSAEDFFLAGRRLPGGLIYVSLTASWFGATSILVTADEAFAGGLSAIWIIGVPAVATVVILAVLFAGRLHQLPVLTWSDLVELRYGRTVRHLASVLLVWYMALLAASQMSALGLFLGHFLAVPYGWTLAAGAAVVLIYTACGGLRSVVWTDFLQFALLIAGVSALYFWASGQSAWAMSAAKAADAGKAGYFNLFHDFGKNGLMALSFTLAWTISPIALQRIQAARSVQAARRGLGATAVTLLGLYALVVGIGVLCFPLFPGRAAAGTPLMAEIAGGRTGVALGGLVFVAVLAAILSTMDTAVNAGALVLSRDVIEQVHPGSRKRPVLWGRIATVLIAAAAFLVALKFRNILKTIGLSSEILAEGFFIPGVAMIFLKGKYPSAGLLSVAAGGGFAVLSFLEASGLISWGLPAWPFSVPFGLALGGAGFLLGLRIDKKRK
jgi:solute:Na+ symporter, SSS family